MRYLHALFALHNALTKANDNKTQKIFLPQNAIIFCNNAFCHFFVAFLFLCAKIATF